MKPEFGQISQHDVQLSNDRSISESGYLGVGANVKLTNDQIEEKANNIFYKTYGQEADQNNKSDQAIFNMIKSAIETGDAAFQNPANILALTGDYRGMTGIANSVANFADWLKNQFVSPIAPIDKADGTMWSWYYRKDGTLHGGVDIAAEAGTKILSMYDGVVKKNDWVKGYGWVTCVEITSGPYKGNVFRYAHQLEQSSLTEGQALTAGDVIGKVGNSGIDNPGPNGSYHLHIDAGLGTITDIGKRLNLDSLFKNIYYKK